MEGPAQYLELSRDVSAKLQDSGRFLGGLVEGGSDGGHQLLLDQELSAFFTRFYQLKGRHQDRSLSCAVLALTKSGKSTLLNALLGAICLPSSNVPETARITRIIHTPLKDGKQPQLTYQPSGSHEQRTIVGEYGIREHLRYLNREVRTRNHHASDEAFLDVHIPVAALDTTEIDPEAVSLQLLDTPGPNEFGEESLKHQVERLLDSVDAVLYLLDYSKLKTAEEATLLGKLKDINPQLVARLSQRLFFVVNKVDLMRTSEGLEPEEIKEYVANLVTSQLATEGFQLLPDQVLLLSAQDAMLSRLILRGKAGKEERLRFGKLAFGARKAASTPDEDFQQAAEEMLRESGLEELEERVLGFLCTNSGSLKLLSTLDDAQRLLQQVHNVAAASNAALQQDVQTLQEETAKLQTELEDVLEQFDGIQQEANEVETQVVDEVRERMQHLKEDLFEKVSAVLESPSEAPNGQAALRAALAGRWQAALDKAARFWERHGTGSSAQRADLQAPLQDLHQYIHSTIDAEVRGFWAHLETATNERQQAMFRMLNTHLKHLAQRVETAVGELLEVHLEPAQLHLEPPTAQQFHTDLQELFSTGISPREVERTREGREEHVVWEKRRRRTGLCHFSDYYVGRPALRSTTESYKETVFELQPDQIMSYFMKLVDDTVEASVRHVRAFVHQYLSARLAEARAQIEQYGNRYTEAMLHALDTSKQGEEARTAALAAVQQHLAIVGRLLEDIAGLQQRAAVLLPATHPEEEQHLQCDSDVEHHADEAEGSAEEAGAGAAPREDTDFEDAHEELSTPGAAMPDNEPVSDLNPSNMGPAPEAPAASTQAGAVPAAAPAVLPAARKRTGRAQTVPVFDSEEEEAPSAKDTAPSANGVLHLPYPLVDEPKGKKHVDYPVIEQAQEEPGPSARTVHASLLDAIWNRRDVQAADAGKVAAASIDKAVNPPTAAMAAHQAANSISSYVDFAKWGDMDGFTDSDEDGDILCSCGKVHPPTFHQPWRTAAAREEAAAGVAPASNGTSGPPSSSGDARPPSSAAEAADLLDHPAERASAGSTGSVQDAAHLTAPAADLLPASYRGPTPSSEEVSNMEPAADPARGDALDRAFEMWVHGGDDVLAVHHGHPDGPAILPAEHVRDEDAPHHSREMQSHDSSDDWTIVENASEADDSAEPQATKIGSAA